MPTMAIQLYALIPLALYLTFGSAERIFIENKTEQPFFEQPLDIRCHACPQPIRPQNNILRPFNLTETSVFQIDFEVRKCANGEEEDLYFRYVGMYLDRYGVYSEDFFEDFMMYDNYGTCARGCNLSCISSEKSNRKIISSEEYINLSCDYLMTSCEITEWECSQWKR